MIPVILDTKLKLGGRWYYRGDKVTLNDRDAEDYIAMHMAHPAPKVSAVLKTTQPETVKVSAIITKDSNEQESNLVIENPPVQAVAAPPATVKVRETPNVSSRQSPAIAEAKRSKK